jgi:hypothetical protein
VQRRWGSWGVFIFMLWAIILAFVAFARMLLLTKAVELYSNEAGNQTQVWTIFIINGFLGLGFGGSAFGLWQRDNWGRILFLWVVTIWSGFSLVALFFVNPLLYAGEYSLVDIVTNGLRVLVGLIISLWYFNLPYVKAFFQTKTSEKFVTEDNVTNDTII